MDVQCVIRSSCTCSALFCTLATAVHSRFLPMTFTSPAMPAMLAMRGVLFSIKSSSIFSRNAHAGGQGLPAPNATAAAAQAPATTAAGAPAAGLFQTPPQAFLDHMMSLMSGANRPSGRSAQQATSPVVPQWIQTFVAYELVCLLADRRVCTACAAPPCHPCKARQS